MDDIPFAFSGGLRPRPARLDRSSREPTEFLVLPIDHGKTRDGRDIIGHFGVGLGHTWQPEDVPDLHKRFSHLNEHDVHALAAFARQYGFLVCDWTKCESEPWEPIELWRWHVQRVRFARAVITQTRRLIAPRKNVDKVFRELCDLIANLPPGRIPDCLATEQWSRFGGWQSSLLHKLSGGTSEHPVSNGYNIEHDGFRPTDFSATVDAKIGVERLHALLSRIVSDPLSETTRVFVEPNIGDAVAETKDGKLVVRPKGGKAVVEPSCLLGVIYLGLLRQATSGKVRVERNCLRCGERFIPDHGNDAYCGDPDCTPGRNYDEMRSIETALDKGARLSETEE